MLVYVPCRCGKKLRALDTDEGASIRCWNCHEMVTVPRRRRRPSLLGFRKVFWSPEADEFALKVLVTLSFMGVLAIPKYGGWAALGLAGLLLLRYLGLIEDEGREGVAPPGSEAGREPPRRVPWLAWFGGWLLLSIGFVGPFALRYGINHVPGLPTMFEGPLFWTLWLLGWGLGPLAAYALAASNPSGPIGPRLALSIAWRRLRTTLLLLFLPVATFLAIEAALALSIGPTPIFPIVAWNYLPLPEDGSVTYGTVQIHNRPVKLVELSSANLDHSWPHYIGELGRGFTLTGALAVSMTRPFADSFATLDTLPVGVLWFSHVGETTFHIIRLSASIIAGSLLVAVLIAQARLLGRLPVEGPEEAGLSPTEPVSASDGKAGSG